MWEHLCQSVGVEVRGHLAGSILASHRVGLGDQTQVDSVGGKHLYSLGRLAAHPLPRPFFFFLAFLRQGLWLASNFVWILPLVCWLLGLHAYVSILAQVGEVRHQSLLTVA